MGAVQGFGASKSERGPEAQGRPSVFSSAAPWSVISDGVSVWRGGSLEVPGSLVRGFRTKHASQAHRTPDTVRLARGTLMIPPGSTAPKVQATLFVGQDPPSQDPAP